MEGDISKLTGNKLHKSIFCVDLPVSGTRIQTSLQVPKNRAPWLFLYVVDKGEQKEVFRKFCLLF